MSNQRQEGARAPKFALGRVLATPGALDLLNRTGIDPSSLISRHHSGDWGDICKEDAAENDRSVENGFRILSSYKLPLSEDSSEGRATVWIITEADRSVTTLLLPREY